MYDRFCMISTGTASLPDADTCSKAIKMAMNSRTFMWVQG